MSNLFTSPNDPLFFIHHGGIDHFWFQWQGRNKTRFKDVRRSVLDFHRLDEPVPPEKVEGITTMDTPVFQTGEFAPLIHISQVMDTINEDRSGFLCYVYDSEYVDFRGTPVARALPNGGRPDLNQYPFVPRPISPLRPWSGLPPEDGGGMEFESEPMRGGRHHHGSNSAMPMPDNSSATLNSSAVLLVVETPSPTLAVDNPEPSSRPDTLNKEKSKTSGAQKMKRSDSFLGEGVQPGSGLHAGSLTFYDPCQDSESKESQHPKYNVQPIYSPLPEYTLRTLASAYTADAPHPVYSPQPYTLPGNKWDTRHKQRILRG
jgi:hypothetical protein